MIYQNILELIGHTPVVKYPVGNNNNLYLKLEMFNPAGSIKDRVAYQMIMDLRELGLLNKDTKIVESTSGNTGIGLAFVLGTLGIHPYIFLPSNMSKERIDLLKAYGAKIILTDAKLGMKGAKEKAQEFAEKENGIFINQFENESNIRAHELTTAPEILNEFPKLDYLIAGIGTSGTIVGLSHILKRHYPFLKVLGVEPYESSVLEGYESGPHGIQGIGAGFIPPLFESNEVDELVRIKTNEANELAKELALKGLFLGISSCAAIKAGLDLAEKVTNSDILVICPDGGDKYLSLGVYNNE